jgi:alpha-glucosidase
MQSNATPRSSHHDPWWRGAVIYQLYPRSFADANGDGLGDLSGIASRLPYVAALGVDGIWICPFFPSPMRDFGYDVSDYCNVDPRFGTLADFDALLAQAHRLGLKVLIDQVWSHTAIEHPWFAESRSSRDNPKADWYVWADAKPDGSPPSNWQSWMGNGCWTWEPRRRQYYLHNFLPQMPDLNLHSAAVQDAILDIARFWLDRGVDGFRLDTANYYCHDRALTDNPPQPPERRGDLPAAMQQHMHNICQPETLGFLERVRALMDRYDGRMAVAEIGSANNLERMVEYTQPGRLHTAYSFMLLGGQPDARALADAMTPWQEGEGAAGWPAWALSNHDVPRVATRWGGDDPAQARLWLLLLLALRGTVFIYQGEELGLRQSEVAFEHLQDPFGKAHWPRDKGRDGCRTPMPWRRVEPCAGFTTGTPWLPADPAHAALAVDVQEADAGSMLHFARRAIAFRRAHPALRWGSFEPVRVDGAVLVARRGHGDDDVLAAFNFGDDACCVELPAGWRLGAPALATHGAVGDAQSQRLTMPAHSGLLTSLQLDDGAHA